MNKYILKNVKKLTDTCYELNLVPNSPSEKLQFSPGQYIALSIKGQSKKSTVRCFSIASSPMRSDDSLDIGIRLGSKYTKLIRSAPQAAEVYIEGPFGEFTPDLSSNKNLVLIAGGIGITPMVSILETISLSQNKRRTALLYFNNQVNDVPYINEINQFSTQDWLSTEIILRSGETTSPIISIGELDKANISKVTSNIQSESDYYICGPPGFMKKAVQLLSGASVPLGNIHTESFGNSPTKKVSKFSPSRITYLAATSMIILSVGAIATKDFIEKELKNRNNAEKTESTQVESTSRDSAQDTTTKTSPQQATQKYQSPRSTVS